MKLFLHTVVFYVLLVKSLKLDKKFIMDGYEQRE